MLQYWPQILYVSLLLIDFGLEAGKHGQNKKGKHNARATLIANSIILAILYFGGFFATK